LSPATLSYAIQNHTDDRVVFNIKGNDYRLVVMVRYDKGLMFVKFVGTHSQYDKIDAVTV